MEIGTNDVLAKELSTDQFKIADPDKSELGQEDFLLLLTTQLENQDPFEPINNGEFIADLAAFGSLDSINGLSDSFADFTQNFLNSQVLNSASLIGKNVLLEGNQINFKSGESVEAFIDAGAQAGVATVQITNAAGELVHAEQISLNNTGLNGFTWDGLDSNGNEVPEGTYFLSASIKAGENESALSTTVKSKIQSINLNSINAASIEVGLASGKSILLDQITQITE